MSNERIGYWKFHRKLWNNPLISAKPAYLSVWCWLLSEAQFENGKETYFRGTKIKLKSGQFTCGSYQISSATGVPRGTVERIIKRFKNEEQIEVQTDNKKSLITIVKWSKYQSNENQNEEQVRNKWGTSEEQVRTTEEVKKERSKEVKNNTLQPVVADKDNPVNKIFQIFYESVNPAINFGNTTSRQAAQWLIDKYGPEKALKAAEYACSIQGEQYAPTITTPYQLKNKLAEIRIYFQKQNNSSVTIIPE